jgi:hypothetical protein
MHLSNAIIGTVQNQELIDVVNNSGININRCAGIKASVINPNVDGRMTIEVVFDFIPAGQSSNDMRVRVFYDPSNRNVEIHSIERPW